MSVPVLKLRQSVQFPAQVEATKGIDVSKANGIYTFETDWSQFPRLSAVSTSPTNSVLTFDTLTGIYSLIPSNLFGGAGGVGAAEALTGTTLASNVVNSSLQTVGNLTGGSTGFGFTINLGSATIIGTLPVANGGTGATTPAAAAANLQVLPLTGGTLTGPLNLPAPSGSSEAATKAYVDTFVSGLQVKSSVVAASTINLTSLSGTLTVDGVSVTGASASRVLVKNQAVPANNGIYISNTGAWTRAPDLATSWSQAVGAYTLVTGGSTLANTGWTAQVSPGGTIGSTDMPWAQFSSQVTYGATLPISLGGNTFSIGDGAITNAKLANSSTTLGRTTLPLGGSVPDLGINNNRVISWRNGTDSDDVFALYLDASNVFHVGGAQNVTIAGKLGIGTVAPSNPLTVVGNMSATGQISGGNFLAQGLVIAGVAAPPIAFVPSSGATKTGLISQNGDAMFLTSAGVFDWVKLDLANGDLSVLRGDLNVLAGNLNVAGNFNIPGNLNVAGSALFKNGQPWADITAWGAIGDGNQSRASANTTAIQNAINQVVSVGGGVVFIPAGSFIVAPGINLASNVRLVGAGKQCSGLVLVNGTDAPVVTIGPNGQYQGMEHLSVLGYIRASDGSGIDIATGAAATYPCVWIPPGDTSDPTYGGTPVFIANCIFWGGRAGLLNYGSDGCFIDNFIWGWHACLESYGSNSYLRCKFDSANDQSLGIPTFCAYYQSTPAGGHGDAIENVFTNCDFSGTYNYSVYTERGGGDVGIPNRMMSHFVASVFAAPVILSHVLWASFSSCELGDVHAAGNTQVSMVNCFTPGGTGHIFNDDGTCTYKTACCFNITGAS